MFGTVFIYAIIYLTLRTRLTHAAGLVVHNRSETSFPKHDSHCLRRGAKYMVLYPTVYICCTLPLAVGRMAAMTGMTISYWYYCLAGAAIASCGWLDVILYACTRRVLVFSDNPPRIDDLGLNTFGITHVVGGRPYEMTTTIESELLPRPVHGHRAFGGLSSLHTCKGNLGGTQAVTSSIIPPVMGIITTKTTIESLRRSLNEDQLMMTNYEKQVR